MSIVRLFTKKKADIIDFSMLVWGPCVFDSDLDVIQDEYFLRAENIDNTTMEVLNE